ncbi:hypothetical protein EON79_21620 [bacterium]|nr:MAG: hypothetical protein EON79_21620 [bacterium]
MSRTLAFAFLPLAAVAAAQPSDVRQVGADGPPVLDSSGVPLDLHDSGWALIETSSDNIFSPPRFGGHHVLRSPTGEIYRVPTPGIGYGQITAKTRDDGGLVAIKAGYGKLFVWRRGQPQGEVFTIPTQGSNVRAIVGDDVLLDAGGRGILFVSSIDGSYRYAPTPFYNTLRLFMAAAVSPDGEYAVYNASASGPGYWVFANVASGSTRAYAPPVAPNAHHPHPFRYSASSRSP